MTEAKKSVDHAFDTPVIRVELVAYELKDRLKVYSLRLIVDTYVWIKKP